MYSLTDQIRRSSRSIGAQIAEAWAKRRYEKHFISKLTDADGELMETQHWIGIAYDYRYVSRETALELRSSCQEIGRMIGGMIAKADRFSPRQSDTLRETTVAYLTLPINHNSSTDDLTPVF